ncbi:hypothetical protein LSCM1_05526 [Leishmania martiniquensis]|uniref:Uncharacterized protein n=1 Tax=Leishmania martiniquensis TaxID=1580590 RepID=A0A836KXE8_9TRYP|nr:hypothetical protein LSCM1_05526 [Leishmania martiniquensis]
MPVMHSSARGGAAALLRRRLLPLLLPSFLVYVYLCGSFSGGRRTSLSAHAAAPKQFSQQPWHNAGGGDDASHAYPSLQDLNAPLFGAPYTFAEVNDDRGDGLVTVPTDEEVAVAVQRAREEGRRAGHSVQTPYSASTGGIDAEAVSADTTTSMCAADFTCPRSSVAWASGSFTVSELLTPHSLAVPVGLTLKLSLCCQYRFDGTLLRSTELYDVFLEELLRASPFQVLSAAEKRELFPHALIFAVDTWDRRRTYNTSYALTDADVAEHNDGDGDVLVLTTGALTPATLLKLITSTPALSGDGGSPLGTDDVASTKGNTADSATARQSGTRATANHREEAEGSDSVGESWPAASADVQLHITSRVLKCKCPHILTVMPLLHLQRDVLPPINIVGLGSHCGVPTSTNNTRDVDARQSRGSPLRAAQHIRRVRGADGAAVFAVFFEITPPVPPMSLVTWTVRSVVEEKAGSATSLGEPSRADERRKSSTSGSGVGDVNTSSAQSSLILRHSRLLPVLHHSGSSTDGNSDTSAASTWTGSHLLRSSAASPFFIAEPNVRYEVFVRVSRRLLVPALLSRGPGAPEEEPLRAAPAASPSVAGRGVWSFPAAASTERVARGRFVLRLPLNRSWALPPVRSAPHFGFRRAMRLTNGTLSRTAVMAALNPHYPLHASFPDSPPLQSAGRASSEPDSAGWISGGSSGTALRRRRPLAYYGYWENAPLRDQPLPQQPTRVLANPYTEASASDQNADGAGGDGDPGSVPMPLFLGRNFVAYLVRDIDDVCDPVVLEGHEVWAVQSHITTTGPTTACGEQQDVSALVLRQLFLRMRIEPRLEVTVPNTTWLADPRQIAEAAREGYYRCEARSGSATATPTTTETDSAASPPVCVAAPDVQRDASEVYASLRMSSRGVYEVVWVARVAVREEWLISRENLDPLYTRVIPVAPSAESSSPALFLVEVRSRPLLVVRRLASYPHVVAVEVPMHARRWVVPAPHPLTEPTSPLPASAAPLSASQRQQWAHHRDVSRDEDALGGNVPTGHWRSRFPLHVLSVDEQLQVELDTNDVPNVQRVLPNGTLTFVAQDTGEALSLSVVIDGAVRTVSYTSQCPDTHVEHQIYVVALPPPPIVPAFAPIYTEEGCVVLVAPREVRKDEVAEWRVPPCASASQPPYLVERPISLKEWEETRLITTAVDGGAPLALTAAAAATGSMTALMACGVEAYHHCEIVWSVQNLVATVHKRYSLRRCQRPPDIVFHEDGRQQRASYPQANVFGLPSLRETAYTRASGSALAPLGAASASMDAAEVARDRRVIPIAGLAADIGYSFHVTDQQNLFEMELRPVKDAVAHQLWNTQHEYAASKDGPMLLRRRARRGMPRQRQETPTDVGGEDEWGTDAVSNSSDAADDEDTFWGDYHTSKAPSSHTKTVPPKERVAELSEQRERRRRRYQRDEQLDTELEKTYTILHESEARRLRVAGVGDASLFLMDYVVRGSPAVLSAEAEADKPEFVRRGMCVEQPGSIAVLAVSPRGAVRVDERYGTVLPLPPAPAVAVLSFCAPQYTFARYPELFSVYGYDFTWRCPDTTVMKAEKHHPTYSVLHHAPERYDRTAAAPSANTSEALCELTVTNRITDTERRDWFVMRRVHPSPLPATALTVPSHNAADSLQVVPPSSPEKRRPRSSGTRRSGGAPQRSHSSFSAATPSASAQDATEPLTSITMEQLYTAPANTYPFARARHIVGKSAVLHVDAPSDPAVARWAVTSVVPAASTTAGSQVLMDDVEFQPLPHHPTAAAHGGSAALIKGLRTPGLYTITHSLPDPQNPDACPPVTLTDMLDVFHAQVLEKELFVCGDTAALRAVPIPREIAHEFAGQWEVVSLATGAATVWTAGVNFTGLRFDHGTRAETRVRGLPFGVVRIRWAIYRLLPLSADKFSPSSSSTAAGSYSEGPGASGRAASSASTTQHRVLADYDTVDVFVLTENLPSHRLVTLADRAAILTTSSTQNWRMEVVMPKPSASAAVDVATQARMSLRSIHNYSHSEAAAFFSSSDDTTADSAARRVHRTYFGQHPRPGSGVLLLEHLPIGTVHLYYDLVPSRSIFGRMGGHTCTLKGHYEVERVSAYLTATTSMDHECDGYTGKGRITLCLHTEGGSATESGGPKGGSQKPPAPSCAGAQFWQSQVRLIDPAALEDTVKHGAREVERLSGGRCATPWWVSPTTQWLSPSYTLTSAVSSPGRCISFTVKAGRHLSAREVLQPLFVAVPRPSPSIPTSAETAEVYADRASNSGAAGAATHIAADCPFHGDFISTRIIDGAPGTGARVSDGAGGAYGRDQKSGQGGAASATSRLGLSQLFQLGLPHTLGGAAAFASTLLGRDGSAGRDDGSGDGDAWGIRYLPVLQPGTLRRANLTMRPMVGLRGAPDDVTYEVNISGRTAAFGGPARAAEGPAPEAAVLLRLDLSRSRLLGGFFISPSAGVARTSARRTAVATMPPGTEQDTSQREAGAASSNSTPAPTAALLHHSLLHKCVDGTVRGADVLQYWTETNRPDGRVDRTVQEWIDYAFAVREATVPCDVLFGSLDHLISKSYGSGPSTASPASPSPGGGWYATRGRRGRQGVALLQGASPSSQRQQQEYISLAEMEQQVERVRRQLKLTPDGIDVTGLPADLQSALSHRRVTATQLRAIEAVRKARRDAEEAALAEETRQRTTSHLSPTERLANALRAYQGVAQGSEVAVLRIRLPLKESFTVPYDVFLRAALHKDVLCGTTVDPPPSATDPTAQPTVANPHSLVPLGRVEVRDTAPVLSVYPPVVKQCEVEGGMPVLTFELTGANFARTAFAADAVTLEEIPNRALEKINYDAVHHPDVGLAACIEQMRRGLRAAVEVTSRKRLYLQLRACPNFRMLTSEEYNEHQDSEALLQRLQLPRYLRVTVRNSIQADSFLAPLSRTAGSDVPNASARQWAPAGEFATSVTATSTDASFVLEVRPTLARLHLRSYANVTLPDAATKGKAARGRPRRESGSWWGGGVATATSPPSGPSTSAATELAQPTGPSFDSAPARPLLLCEADLRRYGLQLGVELIGDTWTRSVGEDGDSTDPFSGNDADDGTAAHEDHRQWAELPRRRAPPNVALINSFRVVEHHSLDSSHHLYMKGGGVYRSHFIDHLFSEVLSDPTILQGRRFVYRYNDTFIGIAIPPLPTYAAATSPQRGHRDGAWGSGQPLGAGANEYSDAHTAPAQQSPPRYRSMGSSSGATGLALIGSSRATATPFSAAFPAVREFSRVEEILFAVPGIATECRGCLLADTTFYVAGDLTGLWTASPSSATASTGPGTTGEASTTASAAGTANRGAPANGAVRAQFSRAGEGYTSPLVLRWDSAIHVPRRWQLDWFCPAAAHRALERLSLQIGGRSDRAALSIVMDIILYRLRGVDGEALPAAQRPMVLLSSAPINVADVMRKNHAHTRRYGSDADQITLAAPLVLRVNQTAADAAYTEVADDMLRRRRHAHTVLEYHRDDRYAGGLLVVNASVFLKVCTSSSGGGAAPCMIVSITDALLTVEAPKAPKRSASWTRRLLGLGGGAIDVGNVAGAASSEAAPSPVSLPVLLHHVLMAFLVHELLPLLGIIAAAPSPQGTASAVSASPLEDQRRARLALSTIAFLFFFAVYAYGPPTAWRVLCLAVWSVYLYCSGRAGWVFVFVASTVYAQDFM